MDKSEITLNPGLYVQSYNGTLTKLPADTWYKANKQGEIIQPVQEESILPPLIILATMISGFSTGLFLTGTCGLPILGISGTIFALSSYSGYCISHGQSPEEGKAYWNELSKTALGSLAIGFASNFTKK
jgi:hypothetical protein